MPSHTIFNERPECQDRLIQFLINMGYDYVSRSEAESKRRNLSSVLFEDELIRFLQKQTYTYNGHELLFSGESIDAERRSPEGLRLFSGGQASGKRQQKITPRKSYSSTPAGPPAGG